MEDLFDDTSSFTESVVTASSSSTVLGPGAITGRFLHAVGGKSLDLVVSVVIRRRLAVTRQTLEKNPNVLRNPKSADEWKQMKDIRKTLKELCREEYSLSLRRTAANLIRDITVITRAVPAPAFIDASPTNGQWEALLARVDLSQTEETVISTNRQRYGAYEGVRDVQENRGNGLQVEVTVHTNQSVEVSANEAPPYASAFRPQVLGSRRSRIPIARIPGAQSPEAQSSSARNLDRQARWLRRDPKVLVLGAGGVGKSTMVRQIRALQTGWNGEESRAYREIILNSVIKAMESILLHEEYQMHANSKSPYPFRLVAAEQAIWWESASKYGPSEAGGAIRTLWNEPEVRECARRIRATGGLPDSAEYFLNAVDRIFASDYVPTQEDVMRTRMRTTGIQKNVLDVGNNTWRLIDTGGERAERMEWVYCFENATAVLFVTALTDYNKTVSEAAGVNRMDESLALFESIVNSRWFTNTLMILIINKVDAFKEELENSPLNDWMPEYEGETYEDACEYIEKRFVNLIQDKNRPFAIQYVSAVDAADMSDIFYTLRDEISRHHRQHIIPDSFDLMV